MTVYQHGSTEVGVEPTLIVQVPQGSGSVLLQNLSDQPIFVGGPMVAVEGEFRGFAVGAGENTTLPAVDPAVCELYGVVADGTAVVVFLYP